MKKRIQRSLTLLIIIPLLAACQAGSLSLAAQGSTRQSTGSTTDSSSNSSKQALYSSTNGTQSVSQIVSSVRTGIVEIIAQQQSDNGWRQQTSQSGYATGTGFVIDSQGHILTNYHVVEGASKLTVVLPDNKTEIAQIVGTDPQTDLAVLKVKPDGLTPLKLGDSSKLVVGEGVVAIGYALNLEGGSTVTTGVVSAVNRSETEPAADSSQASQYPGYQGSSSQGTTLYGLVQTDAAVNPGNSGGPLLDMNGEVIGINTLGEQTTSSGETVQGINFAISIDTAKQVAQEIIQNGHVTYPYIGIETEFLYPEDAVINDLPDRQGQYVVSVLPNTPAARSGLEKGDIITAINGQKITDESTFVELLRQHDPGDNITLTIYRNGKQQQLNVTLAQQPSSEAQQSVQQP